jgi:ABC-type polysaccharide/polyol phosphate export permease
MLFDRIKKLYKLLPPLLFRDIKERYAGSVLGVFWTFLQPLLFILLYWLIFSQIMKVRIQADTGEIPFLAFLLSGLLPWFALQEGILRGSSSIVDKRHILKKVIFPAELFPLVSVISAFIQHGIGIIIFLFVYFIWRGTVSPLQLFAIAGLLSLQIVLTSGLSLLVASLSVYLRDIIQILNIVFQILFYVSPILYPISSVPKGFRTVIFLNPFTALIEAYHDVILYGRYPALSSMLYLLALTIGSAYIGIYMFRKLKGGFADVL